MGALAAKTLAGTLTIWQKIVDQFGNPTDWVRASMSLVLIGTMLWMQWYSPKDGAVPSAVISAAGLVTGYYLTSDSTMVMKAVVSVIYVLAFSRFMLEYGWVPESVNAQVTMVLGIYFGRKQAAAVEGKPNA